VANQKEILPGFICDLDLLAKVAHFRPVTETQIRRIIYHIPTIWAADDGAYTREIILLTQKSRADDGLGVCKDDPSYIDMMLKLAKYHDKVYITLMNESPYDLHFKWFYLAGAVTALAATILVFKTRTR
jgi:hypothetical protein